MRQIFSYLLKSSPGPREPIRGTSVYHVTHLNTNLSYRRKGVHPWHSVEASINWGSITSRENNKCVIINDVVMMDMDYPVPEEFLKTWQASVTELERERHPFTQNAEIEFTRWEIYLDIYRNSGRLKLYLFSDTCRFLMKKVN